MSLVINVRGRMGRIVAAVVAAVFFTVCGALLVFVLSPRQALEARRIERMPDMAAEDVAATDVGKDILITGRLEDNPVIAEGGFVAYKREVWQVTRPTPSGRSGDESAEPTGQWETVERIVPDLTVNVAGRMVETLRAGDVTMSGPLHERLVRAFSSRKAEYNGQMLAEGSERVRGFYDGDLVTVLGAKASTGGIIPEEMFAGDRVAFVQHKKSAARGMLMVGLCLMGIAPLMVVGGILSALFGRRRR